MNRTARIAVGVDGFESSTSALRWAIHQAKLTGAVVDAVTAWQIPPGSGAKSEKPPPGADTGGGSSAYGSRTSRARAWPWSTSAMASFTPASGLVS
jgi:Universal stress protein family